MNNQTKILFGGLLSAALLLPGIAAAQIELQPLALRAAQNYQEQARYPEWSKVIEVGGVDPVLADRTPNRLTRQGPNGEAPALSIWNSSMIALPGETVVLYAQLEGLQPLRSLLSSPAGARPEILGEISGELSGALATVRYADDGRGPDLLAGDGIYTARYARPVDQSPALGQAESLMLKVTAALPTGDQRVAVGGLVSSNPAARLTGKVVDRIENGNLVMAIELEVLAPGRIHLAGTAADAIGVPFATAQNAAWFDQGVHSLELSFYGLAFHERGISGPVALTSLALTSANGMPNAMAPVVSNLHLTGPLNLGQLNAAPFNDPQLLEAAGRALASVKLK